MNEDEIDLLLDLAINARTKIYKTLTKQLNKTNFIIIKQKNQITRWAIPLSIRIPNKNFDAILPSPGHTFPFELNTFQKQHVLRLERNQSFLLSTHASSGKTVVADHAISLSLKHRERAVHASPIKALRNQKYRNFQEKLVVRMLN